MNDLTKKILSPITAALTVFSTMPAFAAIPADVEGTRYGNFIIACRKS